MKHPLVTILTGAHVVDSEGVVGDFKTKIRVDPRGVDERLTYPGNAIAACPEETISEFDFALSRRKAIYMPYPGCYPPIPAIDWHTCTKCGKCVAAVGGKGINLNAQPRELDAALAASSSSPPATTRTSRCSASSATASSRR